MICPFAQQRLLPESASQPPIKPRTVILHSAAGRGSLYNFFLNSSNLESHFWISEAGRIEQYIDTERRADANYKANGFAISIETESSPAATEPWTPAQEAALIRLCDWLCKTHGIPAVQAPSPTGEGLGWHTMWGAPSEWTPVAKSCPGPARIVQARNKIIPAVAALQQQQPAPPEPEDGFLSALSEKEQRQAYEWLEAIHREITRSADATSPNGRTLRNIVLHTEKLARDQ